jgi:predicted ArsR family transcriptional regulator
MDPAADALLRKSVLDFMTTNPTAWRIKAIAEKLGVGVQRMGLELSQLNAEGKLVSCTVCSPGQRPEEEYRIAAIEQKLATHRFVVRKPGRPRGPRPADRRPGEEETA